MARRRFGCGPSWDSRDRRRCNRSEPQPQRQARSLSTYTAVAQEGSLPGLVTASGELEAFRLVNVSPKRQGVLKTVYVEEGDSVGRALA